MAIDRIEGAVVAVTGGGRGIGLAIARALAARGAKVSVGDLDVDLARDAAASFRGHGARLDVRDRASFAGWLEDTARVFGPVSVLVNNAGIMPTGAFVDESDAISDASIDVNLRGVILGCKLVLPGMLGRRHGHVVNVASMAGRVGIPGLAVYCATKFAVVGLTEALREEHRDSGVDFTTVLPAKVTTELAAGTDIAARGIPTASPEDVADAVIDALVNRLPEVALPRFIRPLPALQGIAPHWLLRGLRRRLGDRQILQDLDRAARAAYDARIATLASTTKR